MGKNIIPMTRRELERYQVIGRSLGKEITQAKSLIERVFGTLQNRLVKGMRLAGISTFEEASCFPDGYLRTY